MPDRAAVTTVPTPSRGIRRLATQDPDIVDRMNRTPSISGPRLTHEQVVRQLVLRLAGAGVPAYVFAFGHAERCEGEGAPRWGTGSNAQSRRTVRAAPPSETAAQPDRPLTGVQ